MEEHLLLILSLLELGLLELLLGELRLLELGLLSWLPGLALHVFECCVLASLGHLCWELVVQIENAVNGVLLSLRLHLHGLHLRLHLRLYLCLLCLHLRLLGHLSLHHLRMLRLSLVHRVRGRLKWLEAVLCGRREVQQVTDKRLGLLDFLLWLDDRLRGFGLCLLHFLDCLLLIFGVGAASHAALEEPLELRGPVLAQP